MLDFPDVWLLCVSVLVVYMQLASVAEESGSGELAAWKKRAEEAEAELADVKPKASMWEQRALAAEAQLASLQKAGTSEKAKNAIDVVSVLGPMWRRANATLRLI